jgi:hypothetical protein
MNVKILQTMIRARLGLPVKQKPHNARLHQKNAGPWKNVAVSPNAVTSPVTHTPNQKLVARAASPAVQQRLLPVFKGLNADSKIIAKVKHDVIHAVSAGDWRKAFQLLNEIPTVKKLYAGDAHVSEKYTVGEHTERVLYQFDDQKKFFHLTSTQNELRKIKGFEKIDVPGFMVLTLLVHDIGKSLTRNTRAQHDYTLPIIEELMTQFGFSPQMINLLTLIVGNDILGCWEISGTSNGQTSASVISAIKKLALRAGVPAKAFFRLLRALYICDASSYPKVRKGFMTVDQSGKLRFAPKPGEKEGRTDQMAAYFANRS